MSRQVPQSIARYQIIRALGEGGMGSVYLAKDPAIDRFVAIKLLRSGFDDESARERFRREAKAVGQLHHINIVTIFDVGEHEGDPFIAMEYVEGHTIAQIVRSGEEVPLASALNWMDGLCAGLHYAHRRGIIHRDIKPANLVVDEENKVKILDFGIARGPAAGMTQVGMLMGTLNYMSPEQLSGKTIDHRSDIFAVGGVFYELLTGKQAFPGDINSGVLHKILMGQPEPLRGLNPGIAEDVAGMVERCLSKDPAVRYDDLEAMRKELTRARARYEQAGAETTVRITRMSGDAQAARAGRTPGEKTRAELLRQRRERIQQQLARAREALAAQQLAVAADACHQALILDPENAEAFELQERVERLEQAQQWLGEAKNEMARGDLTAASRLLGRLGDLHADLPDAEPLREQIAAERRRKEAERQRVEEQQRRDQARQEAVARARAALGRDEIDAATTALGEARAVDAAHPEVLQLAKAITERAAELRRAQEDARAQAAATDAKRKFAAGEHAAAIALLAAYTPAHPVIAEARAALEFEHGEILRRAAEERRRQEARAREEEAQRRKEEARRREEEERRKEEAKRRELEARQREEDERRKKEQEERRQKEEARREAEVRKQREAEAKRKADEEKQAAAERARQETARKAAEERQRQEAARKKAEEAERTAAAERAAREQAAAAAADSEKTVVMFPPFEAQARKPAVPPATTVPGKPLPARPAETPVAGKPPVTTTPPPAAPPIAAAPPPPPPSPLLNVAGGSKATTLDLPAPVPVTGDLTPVSRWPTSQAARYGAIGAAAALILVLVWWAVSDNPPPPPPTPALVLIDIRPWAALQKVTNASGELVVVDCQATPCMVSLPPGQYHVQASNPFFPRVLEFDMTVTGNDYQQVRQSLPEFDPEEEARRILGGR